MASVRIEYWELLFSLYYQCQSSSVTSVCKALADVYYAAVRAFGGGDASPGKREESQDDLIREYEAKLEIYNQAVKDAQAKGLLPILDWYSTIVNKSKKQNVDMAARLLI